MVWLSDNMGLLLLTGVDLVVVIGFPGDDGFFLEVKSWGWRGRLPLEAGGVPRIVGSGLAVTHRPEEINHGQKISHAEDGRPGGREHVEHLEFLRILIVAARHAEVAEDELREEGQVESQKHNQSGEPCPAFGIEASRNLGPPEMHPAEVT